MRRTLSVVLKWVGRILLVLVPFIIVCSLFWPRGVQFLNPVVCADGQHLDNHSLVATDSGTKSSIELVCRASGSTVNVTAKILLVVAVLTALSFTAFTYSSRLVHPRHRVPAQPKPHA